MSKVFEIAFKLGGELTSSFKNAFSEANSSMEKIGVVAAAIGGAATFTAIATQISEMNDSLAKLSAQTGVYGEDMKELESIAKNVFKQGHGESFDDVTTALATVKQTFQDLDSGEMERLTADSMMLADTFDSSVNEVTRTASVMMKTFGDDSTKTMDLIAYAFQKGGNFSDELLDTMREYSPQFKALGYDSEAFTSILIAGAQAGAFNLDKIGDAAKESFLKVGDGSTSSREALAALGMDFAQIEKDINSGGESANNAFAAVASAIALVQDPAEKSRLAVALMGTPIEDLGPEFQNFFATVNTDLEDFEGAMGKINEVRFDTVGAALKGIGRTLLIDLVYPIGEAVLPYLNQFANFLQNNLSGAIEKTSNIVKSLAPIIVGLGSAFVAYQATLMAVTAKQTIFNTVQTLTPKLLYAQRTAMLAYTFAGGGLQGMLVALRSAMAALNKTMLANPIGITIAAVVGLTAAFVVAYKTSERFRNVVNTAFSSVKNVVVTATSFIATQASSMWDSVVTSAKALPSKISAAISGSSVGKALSGLFSENGIVDGLINSIKVGFSSLPNMLSLIAPTLTTMGLAFLGVSGPIGLLIGGIVSVVGFLYRLSQTNDSVASGLSSAWEAVSTVFAPIFEVLQKGLEDFITGVGPQLMETIAIISASITEISSASDEIRETFATSNKIFGEMFLSIATTVLPLLLQVFQAVFPIIVQVIMSIIPIILQLAQLVIPLILNVVQMVFPMILSIIQSVLPVVATLLIAVVNVILTLAQTVLPLVLSVIQMVFPVILSIIQAIIPIVVVVLQTLVTIINGVVVPAINAILAVVQVVFPLVQMIIQNALAIVNGIIQVAMALLRGDWEGAWNAIKGTAETIMNNIISFFEGINLFEVGKSIIDGLINGIKSMGNTVLGAISGMIPEPIRGAASKLLGAVLPGYAKGGIITSPELAWIGEGGDTESVIPWNNSQRSKDLWIQTGQALGMLNGSGALENMQQQIALKTQQTSNTLPITPAQFVSTNQSSGSPIQISYAPVYHVSNADDLQRVQEHAERDKDDLAARIAALVRDEGRLSFG